MGPSVIYLDEAEKVTTFHHIMKDAETLACRLKG